MKTAKLPKSAREKILETATDLFYRQGYLATGINQIIEEADVSKATFYNQFPSKEDLCLAYLQERHAQELGLLEDRLRAYTTPYDRFLGVLHEVGILMETHGFRGCGFLNLVAEIPDPNHPVRAAIRRHNDTFRQMIKGLTRDLIRSDDRYQGLDVDSIGDACFLIIEGAIVTSQDHQDIWPFRRASEAVASLFHDS